MVDWQDIFYILAGLVFIVLTIRLIDQLLRLKNNGKGKHDNEKSN
jgi:hypothetical protein